jgi:hypothetical protein
MRDFNEIFDWFVRNAEYIPPVESMFKRWHVKKDGLTYVALEAPRGQRYLGISDSNGKCIKYDVDDLVFGFDWIESYSVISEISKQTFE